MTYRIEIWDCSSAVGEYIVMIDTRGRHFKGTAYAQIRHNDHRCQTIVPPMREEILVTFGEVVERSFPIVVGFVVFVFLLFLAVRYCIRQAAVSAAHRKRIDMERYKKISSTEYFGEDEPTEEEYSTKTLRKAKSAFQTRREREKRIEKEIVKAQMLVDGYDNDNSNEATY